jgi:hypothetical protein
MTGALGMGLLSVKRLCGGGLRGWGSFFTGDPFPVEGNLESGGRLIYWGL